MATYAPPTITELGSVADFTRGEGWAGDHDNITFVIWGWEVSFDWGQPPTS